MLVSRSNHPGKTESDELSVSRAVKARNLDLPIALDAQRAYRAICYLVDDLSSVSAAKRFQKISRFIFAFFLNRIFRYGIMQKFLRSVLLLTFLCSGGIPAASLPGEAAAKESSAVAGQWTYRSYRNTPELVNGDASKALALIFGEGVFTFETPSEQTLQGTLDMGGGYVLDLDGKVQRDTQTSSVTIKVVGLGRAGTPTDGWEYDYHAGLAYEWPNGINQTVAFVGSVIRAKPHDGQPAGYVASFIAVKHP